MIGEIGDNYEVCTDTLNNVQHCCMGCQCKIPKKAHRPHICHRYHRLYLWRKICHVEKFQISVKNLNNLWSFIEIYAVFVLNLCGEKLSPKAKVYVWRKNDKYEVCAHFKKTFSKFTNFVAKSVLS